MKPNLKASDAKSKKGAEVFNYKRNLILSLAVLLTMLIFNKELLKIKQTIHFAGEPLLQFTLGEMWGNNNEIAFDNERYKNGLKDQPCIDSVKESNSNRTIVIILVDALRNDHLSFFGYSRKNTPFLDSLFESKSLHVIKNGFSTSTNTIGGISGLFFSKDWDEFGFNGLSLMKFLKNSGYSTYAFLTGFHRDWYGLSALYSNSCDYYYESSINPKLKNDDDLITLEHFKKMKLNPKSFLYIHLLSVHTLGKRNEEFKMFMPDKIDLNTSKKTALVNNYDNGILQTDYVIKEIFQKLKDEKKLDSATIFILSDHGELFGEDGRWGHGGSIHENLISIPILIYDKNPIWYKNLNSATLKDIAPTIANRINSPIPNCWEGHSLNDFFSNRTIELNSVDGGNLPFGKLNIDDNLILLSFYNSQKQKIKQKILKSGNWIVDSTNTNK